MKLKAFAKSQTILAMALLFAPVFVSAEDNLKDMYGMEYPGEVFLKAPHLGWDYNLPDFSEEDLVDPTDPGQQGQAVAYFIKSLGADPSAFDRIEIPSAKVNELFQKAVQPIHVIEPVNPRLKGRKKRPPRFSPETLGAMRAGSLAPLFLRAPSPEIIEYFLRYPLIDFFKGMSFDSHNMMDPEIWKGVRSGYPAAPVCYGDVVKLLIHSEAISIGDVLSALEKIDRIEVEDSQIAVAHVLYQKYRLAGLGDAEILKLADANFDVKSPSATVTTVAGIVRKLVLGEYFYIHRQKAWDLQEKLQKKES